MSAFLNPSPPFTSSSFFFSPLDFRAAVAAADDDADVQKQKGRCEADFPINSAIFVIKSIQKLFYGSRE